VGSPRTTTQGGISTMRASFLDDDHHLVPTASVQEGAGATNRRSRICTVETTPTELAAVTGVHAQPTVGLMEAVAELPVTNINAYAAHALQFGQVFLLEHPDDIRTADQLGAVRLYTMGWASTASESLYAVMNTALSTANGRNGLTVWFLYLKLFLSALATEPPYVGNVWRGLK
jgi:hypothetical protein